MLYEHYKYERIGYKEFQNFWIIGVSAKLKYLFLTVSFFHRICEIDWVFANADKTKSKE